MMFGLSDCFLLEGNLVIDLTFKNKDVIFIEKQQ